MLCLRARCDPSALDEARGLAQAGLDWEAWRQNARGEVVTPLIYSVLRGRGIAPAEVEARLRDDYLRSARDGLLRSIELEGVLRGLAEAGIDVLVLKGAALVMTVYGDIGLRPMTDLDLLVPDGEQAAAFRVAAGAGYQPVKLYAHPEVLSAFESQVLLLKEGRGRTYLEPHWHLLDSPYHQAAVPMDWFWSTAREAVLHGRSDAGFAARVLGREAMVLHLCAHLFMHHAGRGLLWQHDIAELLYREGGSVDWQVVLDRAREYDLVLSVQKVIPAVVAGWGAPVPAAVLDELAGLRPSEAELAVCRRLADSQRSAGRQLLADLAGISGWRRRFGFAAANLFPSPQYMRWRYRVRHGLLLPMYYPYRWFLGLRSVVAGRGDTGEKAA